MKHRYLPLNLALFCLQASLMIFLAAPRSSLAAVKTKEITPEEVQPPAIGTNIVPPQAEVKVKKTLTPDEALQHAQESNIVCGVVASGKYLDSSKSKLTFLNLGRPFPDQPFTVMIPEAVRLKFKEHPEEFFKGKTICVTGLITINREKPQIVINDPSQIQIEEPANSSTNRPPDSAGK